MKYGRISLIVLLASIFWIGKSQNYQGFPAVDGYWKVQYGNVICVDNHGISDVCSEYQYTITGDTLINGKIYHKLSYSGRDRNFMNNTWQYWDLGYVGCFRNDIPGKQVYFFHKDSLNEKPLYDFNLAIGDTLPYTYNYNQSFNQTITIDQIDSVLLGNTFHKRYHMDIAGFGAEYLIEGVGSTLGLLSPITSFFEHHYDLLCCRSVQEGLYYDRGDSSNCDIITSYSDPGIVSNGIHIYPNPAMEHILLDAGTGKLAYIEIYNLLGNKLISIETKCSSPKIPISRLSPGIYVLKAFTEQGRYNTFKFVKN